MPRLRRRCRRTDIPLLAVDSVMAGAATLHPPAMLTCVRVLGLVFTLTGCVACGGSAPAPRARVVDGEQWLPAAHGAMRAQGVVFSPHAEAPVLGVETTLASYQCIEAINQAVLLGLTRRYAVQPARRRWARTGMPPSLQGPAGPRVAVAVRSIRCGLVVADSGYTTVASGDPGGPAQLRGEVVLVVHDRSTGRPMIEVRGEASGPDGLSAARAAAQSAVQHLFPDG